MFKIVGIIDVKDVKDSESTVLYHIYQAVQMDQKIFKLFLRYLKSVINKPEFVLDTFTISVFMSNVNIFKDQVSSSKINLRNINISKKNLISMYSRPFNKKSKIKNTYIKDHKKYFSVSLIRTKQLKRKIKNICYINKIQLNQNRDGRVTGSL